MVTFISYMILATVVIFFLILVAAGGLYSLAGLLYLFRILCYVIGAPFIFISWIAGRR